MASPSPLTPLASPASRPPGQPPAPLPGGLRHRAERCERLSAAALRPEVRPGADHHRLADGTVLALRWAVVRGCWGGGEGRALEVHCPLCSANARVLWRPPGEGWGCWRCRPVSHPSHRRSGSGRGRGKPLSWRLAKIAAEQQQIAEMLGLEHWPPQQLIWRLEDLEQAPRLRGAPRLSRERREALLLRLDVLETLRTGVLLPVVSHELIALGGTGTESEGMASVLAAAHRLLAATAWAMRRPARDPRSVMAAKAAAADELQRQGVCG